MMAWNGPSAPRNQDYFMSLPGMQELCAENCAILISGGLDSAILIGQINRHSKHKIFPIFMRCGLHWEKVELEHLRRFLSLLNSQFIEPLVILDVPVGDLYGTHWSITGNGIPDAQSPDESVFLPGRNILLSSKALLWCHINKVNTLALAILEANPFPDSTDLFFDKMADAVNEGISGKTKLVKPYSQMKKADVLQLGAGLPLKHTFSCINPRNGFHCGACNKCAERALGFKVSGISDPTDYFNG